ncbi:MAG: hypothetical protein EAZ89_17730 [Bacteroidetes bacterium]|nr:MAG: hypothetical protein EAZ89_17730 [Bacteroidota bacterium]
MTLLLSSPLQVTYARIVLPGEFEPGEHWYPKALNAQIHPLVAFFLNMSAERISNRYCHLNPQVNRQKLAELINYQPKYLTHAGADLFHVTNAKGYRRMVVIETNSCPSGQKSMPLLDENQEQGGYRQYIEQTLKYHLRQKRPKMNGSLAVIYDKNPMEASGYAAAMADAFGEPVLFAPFYEEDADPPVRFTDHIMEVRDEYGRWNPIRAAFRYVTQRPWNRIPVYSKTLIFNPIVSCLAGGRNKMMAAKAYEFFNADIAPHGLKIHTPETVRDVGKAEIPLWVRKMGGKAVVKVPYANAGQGVFTIVNELELDAFMAQEFDYDLFIVQSLIGNYTWSSGHDSGKLYHVGTLPNKKNQSYVADLRMMVGSQENGLRPLAIYGRRARLPLADDLQHAGASWDMLGTNLSVKREDNSFESDTARLMMMDQRDFNKLGLSVDELIEGYIQTLLAMIAIDRMSAQLISQKGRLRTRLFRSLNNDQGLLRELLPEAE